MLLTIGDMWFNAWYDFSKAVIPDLYISNKFWTWWKYDISFTLFSKYKKIEFAVYFTLCTLLSFDLTTVIVTMSSTAGLV